MWPAWIGPGPEAGLPANQEADARGAAVQGLHLQLGQEVHEHRGEAARRQLPHVQQGGVGDHAQEVSGHCCSSDSYY